LSHLGSGIALTRACVGMGFEFYGHANRRTNNADHWKAIGVVHIRKLSQIHIFSVPAMFGYTALLDFGVRI